MIKQIEQLIEKYGKLSAQVTPNITDLKNSFEEIKELTSSKEFKSGVQDGTIDFDLASKLKRLQDSLREKLDELSFNQNNASGDSAQKEPPQDNGKSETTAGSTFHDHNTTAKKLMDEADDAYWKGKWKEAYDLYEQVLQIEPDWPRAKDYSQKARYNYDNKVGIPKAAIPDTVKFAFARAESALSRWELENAKTFVVNAQSAANGLGLGKWDELDELAFRVENYIDINNSFQAAIALPESQIDEAIEKVEAAYEQSRRTLYSQKLEELKQKKARISFDNGVKLFVLGRLPEAIMKIEEAVNQQSGNSVYVDVYNDFTRFKETQQEIRQFFDTQKIVASSFIELEKKFQFLEAVLAKYPDAAKNHPGIRDLQLRFDAQRPLIISEIKSTLLALQKRFDSATKIDDAEMAHSEAADLLDLYARLGADASDVRRSTERKESRQLELEKITSDLDTLALKANQKKRFTSSDEAERAGELLERFSNDPDVKKLQKPLDAHESQRKFRTGGIILGAIIALSIFSYFVLNQWQQYVVSLTPTATMTLTPSPTFTVTPSLTPTITPPPSATPLPPKLRILRDLYARTGCYERYRLIGRLPEGAIVTLLPSERKVDDLRRECVLVEYSSSGESIVGWVLLIDLGDPNE